MNIKLDLKFFLFAIIFAFFGKIKIYLLFLVFALIHELGHIIFGLILGFKPKRLQIMPIGFSIYFSINIDDYNRKILNLNKLTLKKLIVYIGGPLTNLLIFLIILLLNIDFNYRNEIAYINIIIGIFNLLPIYPLDGSRILENMLKLFFKNQKAYKYSNFIVNVSLVMFTVFCSFFILYIKNFFVLVILIYLWYIVIQENKIQKIRDVTYDYLS